MLLTLFFDDEKKHHDIGNAVPPVNQRTGGKSQAILLLQRGTHRQSKLHAVPFYTRKRRRMVNNAVEEDRLE